MQKLIVIALITLLGCSAIPEPLATIEGKVSIGPLCGNIPVVNPNLPKSENPCGLSNDELDKIYGQYTVVLKSNTETSVLQQKLTRTGLFTFNIKEGSYTLNIESSVQNALRFSQKESIQKSINVAKNEKSYVELYVNTGIR